MSAADGPPGQIIPPSGEGRGIVKEESADEVAINDEDNNAEGDDGDEDNDDSVADMSEDEVRDALKNGFRSIRPTGDFAAWSTVPVYVDPGLVVDEAGPIKLPLQEPDAQRIIAASHQAPFGKGSETVIDRNVRNTWELNVEQFRVTNAEFRESLTSSARALSKSFGVPQKCRMQLYKMLLYEPGAHFKPHTDTEKAPGMFGTMVICLPAAHEGGDLVLSHNGVRKRFSTSSQQPSCACWYSDVVHEVTQVTSGYRLVLTYNLIMPDPENGPIQTAEVSLQQPMLQHALKAWSYHAEPQELLFVLDHKYTEANLKLNAMKGADRARMTALQYYAAQYEYDLFLATLEHYRSGDAVEEYDPSDHWGGRGRPRGGWWDDEFGEDSEEEDGGLHAINSVNDSSTKLKHVVDLGGVTLLQDIDVEEEQVINLTPYDERDDPDDHEYEGYTGNAGAQSTHWYRDTVVILVGRAHVVNFLTTPFVLGHYGMLPAESIILILQWLTRRLQSDPTSRHVQNTMAELCQFIVDTNAAAQGQQLNAVSRIYANAGSKSFSDKVISAVVTCLIAVKRVDLLAGGIMAAHGSLPPEVYKAVGKLLSKADPNELSSMVSLSLSKLNGLSERFIALQQLFGGDIRKQKGPAADAALKALRESVPKCTALTVDDGYALADTAVCLEDAAFVRDLAEPLLKSHRQRTDFQLAFLSAWTTRVPKEGSFEIPATFNAVFDVMMTCFHLEVFEAHAKKRQRIDGQEPRPQYTTASKTAGDLYWTAAYLISIDKADKLETLCRALSGDACLGQLAVLNKILIPFLRYSQALAANALERENEGCLPSIYFTILNAYLRSYVREQPSAVENWSRNRVACSCQDCWKLNLFLISAMQRHHLHVVLDNARIQCTHETERHTRPETLVVTKKDRRKGEYDAWLARCLEAHNELKQFDQDLLKRILGEKYDFIKDMHPIIADDANAPQFLQRPALRERQNVPIAPSTPAPSRAGVKRKIEVIDLCDSE